jgi:hypothetical protein
MPKVEKKLLLHRLQCTNAMVNKKRMSISNKLVTKQKELKRLVAEIGSLNQEKQQTQTLSNLVDYHINRVQYSNDTSFEDVIESVPCISMIDGVVMVSDSDMEECTILGRCVGSKYMKSCRITQDNSFIKRELVACPRSFGEYTYAAVKTVLKGSKYDLLLGYNDKGLITEKTVHGARLGKLTSEPALI